MNSLNKLQLIGNLVKDPEIKETPSGQKVSSFTIATNHEWKNAQGEKQSITEYHNCVAWAKLADISGYLKKGQKAFIEGRLQTRSWEKDGVKQYKVEVVVDTIIMLGGSKGTATDVSDEFADLKQSEKKVSIAKNVFNEIDIDSIPF